MIFKKPKNALEGYTKIQKAIINNVTEEPPVICPRCKKNLVPSELTDALNVCPYCRYHFRINARQRLNIICDQGTFKEVDRELSSKNILDFPDYDRKLTNAKLESAENEAVVCGKCEIGGNPAAIFVMDPYFMMGSMGSVVGEKITRLFELAAKESLPLIGFTVSGGARMQEGIISLMQMAKTSGAVKRHSDGGNLFVCILTDPTTGGVTASFAMEADIILAEPYALICFAGPRVIEQTIRKKLPDGFQRAEFLLEKGFVDNIIGRWRQKNYISELLKIHSREEKA
ncbi:MAG: acetyl-CoA carboxylase, carboxyltransferase subunit beta [Oscillospiraceae bacterium]